MKILVETSARHVHLCEEDLYKLFGNNYTIKKKKELSQPGQFLGEEKINVKGPKGEINNVSFLGPLRNHTQVELSLTDSRKLGIAPTVKDSGDLKETPGCKLIGPKGELFLKEGVIVPKRHIHLDLNTAKSIRLINGQSVKVKINTFNRSLIFDDVIVKVSNDYLPSMHIDTDESNAAGIMGQTFGEILI